MLDRFTNKRTLSKDSITISFLGRFDPSKGVIDLIEAFLKYKDKNPSSKIILNIAGGGRQEAEIKVLVKNHVEINYFGLLHYDGVDDYLNKSNYSIIPSKSDAFNVVGIESIMNQTPLLLSTRTGLSHYLVDGKECYKFDPTVESMIDLFKKVEDNFHCYTQMSIEARATFIDKFSIQRYNEYFSNKIL